MVISAYTKRITIYDDLNIIEIDFSDFTFDTSCQVHAFYDSIDACAQETGKRLFFLMNYEDCKILPEARNAFAKRSKKSRKDHSLGTVKFDVHAQKHDILSDEAGINNLLSDFFLSRKEAMIRLVQMRSEFMAKMSLN